MVRRGVGVGIRVVVWGGGDGVDLGGASGLQENDGWATREWSIGREWVVASG